jgi:hypothetical protein
MRDPYRQDVKLDLDLTNLYHFAKLYASEAMISHTLEKYVCCENGEGSVIVIKIGPRFE